MRHVTQKTIAPLLFLRSDWLPPSVAICTINQAPIDEEVDNATHRINDYHWIA